MSIQELLLEVGLPAGLCAVVCVAAWRPQWAVAMGLGLAYIAAHFAAEGWPGIPRRDPSQWLLYIAAVAVIVGIVERRLPESGRWGLRAGLAGFAGWALASHVDPPWLWSGVTSAVILANIALLARPARASGDVSVPLALCVAAVGASLLLFSTGNDKLGELTAVVAASLGVVVVLVWRWSAVTLGGPEIVVVSALLTGLLMSGAFGKVPPWPFLIAALAPASIALADRAPAQWRRRPWIARVVAVAAVSAVALAAAIFVW